MSTAKFIIITVQLSLHIFHMNVLLNVQFKAVVNIRDYCNYLTGGAFFICLFMK